VLGDGGTREPAWPDLERVAVDLPSEGVKAEGPRMYAVFYPAGRSGFSGGMSLQEITFEIDHAELFTGRTATNPKSSHIIRFPSPLCRFSIVTQP
jgi:hypothetical protein